MPLHVELVSPEQVVWSGDARQVLARVVDGGDIAFLTGHAPFLGALDIHTVTMFLEDGSQEICAVKGGFIEVSHNKVKILSDDSTRAEHVDSIEARAALARAEETLRQVHEDDPEAAEATNEVKWQTARLVATGEDV